MGDYRVAPTAAVKLQLHAAKYPESAVVGLLLGEEQGQGFVISDAAPLFHHEAPLAPLAEVGCAMADAWATPRGLQIVGLYAASADAGGSNAPSLSFFAEKLADKVAANCSRACVLAVDNAQLGNEAKSGLQLLLKDVKRGWVKVESRLHVDAKAVEVLNKGLKQRAFGELADFEDHLDDAAKDWRNPHVVELLQLNV